MTRDEYYEIKDRINDGEATVEDIERAIEADDQYLRALAYSSPLATREHMVQALNEKRLAIRSYAMRKLDLLPDQRVIVAVYSHSMPGEDGASFVGADVVGELPSGVTVEIRLYGDAIEWCDEPLCVKDEDGEECVSEVYPA